MRARVWMTSAGAGVAAKGQSALKVGGRSVGLGLLATMIAGCGGQAAPASTVAASSAISTPAVSSAKPAASQASAAASKPAASASAGGSASASAKPAASGLTPVSIEVPNKGIAFAYLYVAQDLGIFQKHGIDPRISVIAPPAASAALQAGELDFMSAVGSAMTAALGGLPIRVVEVSSNQPNFLMYGAKGVTSVDQLKGKTVAAYAPGNTVNLVMVELLKRKGLDASQYTILNAGADAGRAAAIQNGAAAATLMEASNALALKKDGFPQLTTIADVPALPFTGLAASQSTLKSKAAVMREAIAATLEGTDLMRTQKAQVLPVLQKEFDLSADDAGQLFDEMQGSWTDSGKPSQAATDFEFASLQVEQKLSAPVKPEQVYDFSIVDGLRGGAGK